MTNDRYEVPLLSDLEAYYLERIKALESELASARIEASCWKQIANRDAV